MTLLEVNDVSVDYGGVPAVRSVSVVVKPGEIVSLIGSNGAGKTSTLKAIFGLVRPRSGSICFRGDTILGLAPEAIVRRGLALVPEGRHIFQSLSVAENLSLARASGRGGNDHVLETVLARFPALRFYYHESAGGLSGGEQQQLAIGRALLASPDLLVLDEPSLGLAPQLVDQLFTTLAELRGGGVTVLLVEQNAVRAVALSDRTYVLRSGSVVLQGTADELGSRASLRDAYLGGTL